jgi:DisA bacterial checkpoint controller nucleotide-binding
VFNETLKLTAKLLAVRDEIAFEFSSNQTCGSKELAIAIQKVNAIAPFIELSEEGLMNLVDLAFKISLKKEESRYSRFQIYVPSVGFLPIKNNEEPDWMVCFDPPIALDIPTLHRISSGMPSRPYALCVWESNSFILWFKWQQEIQKGQHIDFENSELWLNSLAYYLVSQISNLYAYGIIRIEDLSSQDTRTSKHINVNCYPGLILSIEEPGILNVSLSNTGHTIIESLTLRYGKIEKIYDPHMTPIVQSIYADIEKSIRSAEKGELSSNISGYIGNIWSYILSLAVDFGRGGQFIILPSGYLLGERNRLQVEGAGVLQVKHTTSRPDLGEQIALLDRDTALIQRKRHMIRNPFTGEKLPEDNCDSAFKRGVSQGLSEAEHIHDKYQTLFDSARAVAKLSTADGCLVFDRELRLLGFKGEVLVREDPECVELDLNHKDFKQKEVFDINQFGTRHRSAARFCGKVPGAVIFVVSQDGDIRLFVHIDNGKVGIGGPFRPLPGLSPSIVHS